LSEALAAFKEINSPIFVAETELRLVECGVLQGDFSAAAAAATRLLEATRGRAGFEQVEVAALRLLSTARLLDGGSETAGPGSADVPASQPPALMLDLAIERCAAMEATYELAVGLATRAAISTDHGVGGAGGAGRMGRSEPANKDGLRADEIFSRLGVKQAPITWSDRTSGGPLFAYGAARTGA
jgi:hypothetical protein